MPAPGHYYIILLAPIGEIRFVYPLLTIVALGLQKPYTKMGVGTGGYAPYFYSSILLRSI